MQINAIPKKSFLKVTSKQELWDIINTWFVDEKVVNSSYNNKRLLRILTGRTTQGTFNPCVIVRNTKEYVVIWHSQWESERKWRYNSYFEYSKSYQIKQVIDFLEGSSDE